MILIILVGSGQQGYGYNVKYLYSEIGKILGLEQDHNIIIIGAGNLGRALANYASFEKRGFILKGLFDINPEFDGQEVRGVPIHMMDELPKFVDENSIDIAALTIPRMSQSKSQNFWQITMFTEYGILHIQIWNLPESVIVENVHLSESLMRLSYNHMPPQGRT